MSAGWATFEDRVRDIASYIWDRPCAPTQIGGVNIDAVVKMRDDYHIYIEITERKDLNKIRDDVIKLVTAKNTAGTAGIFAQCYCVIEGNVTSSMKEAAKPHHIQVLSANDFEQLFFDFDGYRVARAQAAFGSAVDPFTGARDDSAYVPVTYTWEGSKREVSVKEIAELLLQGRHIVLVGEYGSGKSRCIKELFSQLAATAHQEFAYPIAIDLRESWGLKRAGELVRRHFTDLGLEAIQSQAVRAALKQSIIYLLDGFDEIGSQVWSSDDQKLKSIRAKSLEGVKDLVAKSQRGALIAGREHYFQSNDEMFSTLGVRKENAIVLRAKTEFSEDEMEEYFDQRSIDALIPSWLPRRPLICQSVSQMGNADLAKFFGGSGNEAGFWDHFLQIICVRDARINASFDAETILQVMIYLGRLTRAKSADVGPISLEDVQRAFEFAVGRMPVEEASVMLQRLPALGRIGTDSVERQFIDTAILDSLRAKDVLAVCGYDPQRFAAIGAEPWINALGDLGQRLVAQNATSKSSDLLRSARAATDLQNKIFACDLISSLSRGSGQPRDYGGIEIDNGKFDVFEMSERELQNISLRNCYFGNLRLPDSDPKKISIEGCLASKVSGITSQAALPSWIKNLQADSFDSAQNVALIRRIGLAPEHEVLVTIVRKTFFQKGAGRKEEALLRGLGNIASAGISSKILNLLMREHLLERFRGDEGWVYAPNREHTARMKKLTDQLKMSGDPLWDAVEQL